MDARTAVQPEGLSYLDLKAIAHALSVAAEHYDRQAALASAVVGSLVQEVQRKGYAGVRTRLMEQAVHARALAAKVQQGLAIAEQFDAPRQIPLPANHVERPSCQCAACVEAEACGDAGGNYHPGYTATGALTPEQIAAAKQEGYTPREDARAMDKLGEAVATAGAITESKPAA